MLSGQPTNLCLFKRPLFLASCCTSLAFALISTASKYLLAIQFNTILLLKALDAQRSNLALQIAKGLLARCPLQRQPTSLPTQYCRI